MAAVLSEAAPLSEAHPPPPPAHEPDGYIDRIGTDAITGWLRPTAAMPAGSVIAVSIDGGPPGMLRADLYRHDVEQAGYDEAHVGFHFALPSSCHDGLPHSLTLYSLAGDALALMNPGTQQISQAIALLPHLAPAGGAASPPAAAQQDQQSSGDSAAQQYEPIHLMLDAITEDGVSGWAYSETDPLSPLSLELLIDGQPCAVLACDQRREDVLKAGYPTAIVGFSAGIPAQFFDGEPHYVSFGSRPGSYVMLSNVERYGPLGPSFTFEPARIMGQVDGLHGGAVRGWVYTHHLASGLRTGGLTVLVTWQGQPVAQLTASQFRADVGEAHGGDPNCGFAFVAPPELVARGQAELRFRVMPGGLELQGSPYVAEFPARDTYRRVVRLTALADRLFTQVWALRAEIKALMPAEQYSLENYDAWARLYYAELAARPPLAMTHTPLVSIICPTFRPRMADFAAAVQSVLAQSYAHWELIIVDDASGSETLDAAISGYVAADRRIRAHRSVRNGGISTATNTGVALARGEYVAFFDHDDLLHPRALEHMMAAALRTGARLLYCDEDKIDDQGVYSDPNLKPDWNARYLLAINYVCHLLVVERASLARAGALRPECDGAQDHDLIIRLGEILPAAQIHHVPEILYHWRKTPQSTAASGKAKPYTVAAGIRAIGDHLARRGVAAEVSSPQGITQFAITWQPAREPKVSVLIPYREQAAMTTLCLDALRGLTAYSNYEIVLIDNWSTSEEALVFAAAQAALPDTRVLRIEEKFNYSRINNLAAATCDGEFLLFLNNDVVISSPDWLTQLVGEALACPDTGIVGCKLHYPNGLVQHGGVVLGVGGVADHAHRGLAVDAPGYLARASSPQEMSAVTAACLLCRRDAFEAVDGFDEMELQVAFNDVDLCLKIGSAGFRVIYAPGVIAEHRESLSRGSDLKPEHQVRFFHENKVMESRWGDRLAADPHYSRHFSRRGGMFQDLQMIEDA
jgi:GT2 family glycosyltransferase